MSTAKKVILPSEPDLEQIFQEAKSQYLDGVPNPYKPAVVYVTVAVGEELDTDPGKAQVAYRLSEGPVYAGDALFADCPFYRLPYFVCKGFTSRDSSADAASKMRKELDDAVRRNYQHTRHPLSRTAVVGPPTPERLEQILSKRPLKPSDFEYRTYPKPYDEDASKVARKTLRDQLDKLKQESAGGGSLYNDEASRGQYHPEDYDGPQMDLYNKLRAMSAQAAAVSPSNPDGLPPGRRPVAPPGFGFGGLGFGGFGPGVSSSNIGESVAAAETIAKAMSKLAEHSYSSRKSNPGDRDHEAARARIRAFLRSPQGEHLLSRHRSR